MFNREVDEYDKDFHPKGHDVTVPLKEKPTDLVKRLAVTTLFSLMDSPFWRKCIPGGCLMILRYASVINDELLDPFRRCLQNPAILLYLKGENQGMSILWVLIQWVNVFHLSERIKTQLESMGSGTPWKSGRFCFNHKIYRLVLDSSISGPGCFLNEERQS
jgi:hypothetical protein